MDFTALLCYNLKYRNYGVEETQHMKITEVNTYYVRPRWGFVEIVTDEGYTGWGEAVLEGHDSVERVRMLCVLYEVAGADELEVSFA